MQVNRERKRVQYEVTSIYLEDKSLDRVIQELQGYRAEYGESACLAQRRYPYEDDHYWAIMAERDETDAEMAARIAQEEYWCADHAAREAREYERLRAKFGGSQP